MYHFPFTCIPQRPGSLDHFATRPLPKTESLSRRVITLPFFTSLTAGVMDYMVNALKEVEKEIQ